MQINFNQNKMKKHITLLLTLLFFSNTLVLFGVPAKKTPHTFTQPDGSTITLVLQGDEHFHFYSTTDGVMVKKGKDGYIRYATVDAEGSIVTSEHVAHDLSDRNKNEKEFISNLNTSQLNTSIQKSRSRTTRSTTIRKATFPTVGAVKGLIILAQFKDNRFSKQGSREEFSNMMNQIGYRDNDATGSANDYFLAQSNNKFQPVFDVVGPVTLPENMEYYGGNKNNGDDQNPKQMIIDACKAADKIDVDFTQYDQNSDGIVDLIYVIYAGYAEAQGGGSETIWPHAWTVDKKIILDGKRLNSYACSSELMGGSGTRLDGIGTFCHEYSHCLGLPDLYATNNNGNFGMGEWDVMDGGSYNNNSKTPAGYSAFERYSVGWLDYEELTASSSIRLERLSTSNKAYVIKSPTNQNEYFVFENRQLSEWDAKLPSNGLLITHIDYLQSVWDLNEVNDTKGKQRVTLVPGDNELLVFDENNGSKYMKSLLGDPYPGLSKNTSFSNSSTPAAQLNNKELLNIAITNIQETNDGIITFDFTGGETSISAIHQSKEVYVQGNEIIISTESGEMAQVYSIDGILKKSFVTEIGENRIPMNSGIYIVRIGNKSFKVSVSTQ